MEALKFITKVSINDLRFLSAKYGVTSNIYSRLHHPLKRFCSTNPHYAVAIIGQKDHGKTTLSSAITKVLEKGGLTRFVSYDQINKASKLKVSDIEINACHLEYATPNKQYAHVDFSGHADFVKNVIIGGYRMDCAILVVAATEGIVPEMIEQILLAKYVGVKDILVYINHAHSVDGETLESVKLKVMELLEQAGFNRQVPFIFGSTPHTTDGQNPELGEESVNELIKTLDGRALFPEKHPEESFIMPVDSSFMVKGKGTMAIGTILQGEVETGGQVNLIGIGQNIETSVSDLQAPERAVGKTAVGDRVGILLDGVMGNSVESGMFVYSANQHERGLPTETECFIARVYVKQKSEGGRIKPVTNGRGSMFCTDAVSTYCKIHFLHEEDKEELPDVANSQMLEYMGMLDTTDNISVSDPALVVVPGEMMFAKIYLYVTMILREGQRFSMGDPRKPSMVGIITRVLTENADAVWKNRNKQKPKRRKR